MIELCLHPALHQYQTVGNFTTLYFLHFVSSSLVFIAVLLFRRRSFYILSIDVMCF